MKRIHKDRPLTKQERLERNAERRRVSSLDEMAEKAIQRLYEELASKKFNRTHKNAFLSCFISVETVADFLDLVEKKNPPTCLNCGGKDWHHTTECYLGL